MRTYKVGKTRGSRAKVTLYENGMVVLARTASTSRQAANLGRAWADSAEQRCGIRVEATS